MGAGRGGRTDCGSWEPTTDSLIIPSAFGLWGKVSKPQEPRGQSLKKVVGKKDFPSAEQLQISSCPEAQVRGTDRQAARREKAMGVDGFFSPQTSPLAQGGKLAAPCAMEVGSSMCNPRPHQGRWLFSSEKRSPPFANSCPESKTPTHEISLKVSCFLSWSTAEGTILS